MEGTINMDNNTLNFLAKIKINSLKYRLHINNASIGFILQIIFVFLFFVTAIFVEQEMVSLLFVFPILNWIVALLIKYKGQKIDEEIESFEDDLEFCMTGKIKYKLFNKMIEDLDRKKYHFGVSLDAKGYVYSWAIYRKDMSAEEYFSEDNKPLLTSEENNILDLMNFIKEQKNV